MADRIRKLEDELARLKVRHANLERSANELQRLNSPQVPFVSASRDKVFAKIASVEKRLAVLRDNEEAHRIANPPMPLVPAVTVTQLPNGWPVVELKQLADECDHHAAALGKALRALHQRIVEQRVATGGRGPPSALVFNALERAGARYLEGTPLRSQRGPAVGVRHRNSFRQQIELWTPGLTPAPPPLSPPPPVR
jgi:hypothetical protein